MIGKLGLGNDLGPAGVTLLGGEMQLWSDADAGGLTASGRVAEELMTRLASRGQRPARALLLGSCVPAVVVALASAVDALDVVQRSWPDARDLADALHGRPNIRILAGDVLRLPEDRTYDLIVVQPGIEAAIAPDGISQDPVAVLTALVGRLADPGALALFQSNPAGLTNLVAIDDGPTDANWPSFEALPTAPPGAIQELLASAGRPLMRLSLFPTAVSPTLALPEAMLEQPERRVVDLVSRSIVVGLGHRSLLVDPEDFANRALKAGAGAALAPARLLVLDNRPPGPGSATPDWVGLSAEPGIHPRWQELREIAASDAGLIMGAVGEPRLLAHHGLIRDSAFLDTALCPPETVADRALDACRVHDLAALRAILRRYRDWLLGTDQDSPGIDQVALLDLHNVGIDASGLHPLDPSFLFPIEELTPALVMHLRSFAAELLSRRIPSPWAASATAEDITDSLCAMVDLRHDRYRDAAILLATKLQTALHDLDPQQQAALYASLTDSSPDGQRPWLRGLSLGEAIATATRLAEELDAARAQIGWLQQRVTLRERQLAKVERDHALTVESVSFQLGRKITAPGRKLRAKPQ